MQYEENVLFFSSNILKHISWRLIALPFPFVAIDFWASS